MPLPTSIQPIIENTPDILKACVEVYQSMSLLQDRGFMFLNEQIELLTSTGQVAHVTTAYGTQVELPTYHTLAATSNASTELVQQFQRQIYDVFTSNNPTVIISDGLGNDTQVIGYQTMNDKVNATSDVASIANTNALNALGKATEALNRVTNSELNANVALANGTPPTYQTRSVLDTVTTMQRNSIAYVIADPVPTNNTIYQYNGTAWTPQYDRLLTALGSPRGYLAPLTGAIYRTYQSKLESLVTPEDVGAKGDGTTDDGPAFIAAAANGRLIVLSPNKTYRITSNATVGSIMPNGSKISIGPGATLTFDGLIVDDATVVFTGEGNAVSSTSVYSVGWFAGDSFNAKWLAMKRGFTQQVVKYVTLPMPHRTDPAATTAASDGQARWKLTDSVVFNNTESNLIVNALGEFLVDQSASLSAGAFILGELTAPTSINFPNGLRVLCNGSATYGLRVRGGSSISFEELLVLDSATNSGILWDNYNGPSHRISFDRVRIDGFGVAGVTIQPQGGPSYPNQSPPITSCSINSLQTRGGRSGCTNFVKIAGNVDGLTITNVLEDRPSGSLLFDWSDAMFSLTNTQYGTIGRSGLEIGHIQATSTQLPIIRAFDSTSAADPANGKITFSVEHIYQAYQQNIVPVIMEYSKNCTIGRVNAGRPTSSQEVLVRIFRDCEGISLTGTHYTAVRSQALRTQFDGRFGMVDVVQQNSAIFTDLNTAALTFKFDLICLTSASTYASGWAGANALDIPTSLTKNINVAQGPLEGTTGPESTISISAAENKFFVENRTGQNQLVAVLMF